MSSVTCLFRMHRVAYLNVDVDVTNVGTVNHVMF